MVKLQKEKKIYTLTVGEIESKAVKKILINFNKNYDFNNCYKTLICNVYFIVISPIAPKDGTGHCRLSIVFAKYENYR